MRRGWLAVLFLWAAGELCAVRTGMNKADVIQELGRPTSMQMKSGREVFVYPQGVRIELEKGKVVAAQGIALADAPEGDAAPAAAAEPAPEAAAAAAPDPAAEKAAAEEEARLEKEEAAADARARAELEKAVADMEGGSGMEMLAESAGFNVVRFVVELLARWAFVLVVLKLSAKYWSSEISWKGLAIASGTDVAVRMTLHAVGTVVLGMPSLFYADEAIATLVLIVVLRKVSFNQSLGKAVEIAFTAKVFSTLVGAILFTMALNALF